MILLDGQIASMTIRKKLKKEMESLSSKPKIVFILVGEHLPSMTYVRLKEKACQEIGAESQILRYPQNLEEKTLLEAIEKLNQDPTVHGLLIQLPLPKQIDVQKVVYAIDPKKDVDCFHPLNLGKLLLEDSSGFLPCTPLGILKLLAHYNIDVANKECVILGRSLIVGRPLSILLSQKSHLNATVTLCHSQTKHLKEVVKRGDLVIAAIGSPKLITKEFIKEGAVVIDVGINSLNGKIVGDVDQDSVKKVAKALSPVPKGVGPMTITALMLNLQKSILKLNEAR